MAYKIEYYKDIQIPNFETQELETKNQHFIQEFGNLEDCQNFMIEQGITANIEEFEPEIINNYELRIKDLLLFIYKDLHPSKIDFTKNLDENIVLQKIPDPFVNNRPTNIYYKYNNENICKRHFEFEFNTFLLNEIETELCTRRKEYLGYFNTNNEILNENNYLIFDEIFDFNIEYHRIKMIREKELTENNAYEIEVANSIQSIT